MKILALSDIHGVISNIDCIADELKRADIVIIAGDLTNFDGSKEAKKIIDRLKQYNTNILAVHGNCDLQETANYLQSEGISLHRICVEEKGYYFTGVGGVLPSKSSLSTPYDAFEIFLDFSMDNNEKAAPLILVTHQPAYNTTVDQTHPDCHAGSVSIRNFIEKHQPVLAISGHIHEASGQDKVGKTVLVNPGPFRSGYYAVIEIKDDSHEVGSIEFLRK